MSSGARRFAVFDVDGTIIRTALFLQIVDEMIASGDLPANLRSTLDAKLEAYQTRTHSDAFVDFNETVFQSFMKLLPTLSVKVFYKASKKVVERSHKHVYVYTRELIKKLKAQNYFLIAISGSEQQTVEHFTSYYGFDLVVGDRYTQKDGLFTGEFETDFHNKGAALERIVKAHNLTFAGSVGVGDSFGDAKMLERTEQPIAFNPEAKLFEHAKQSGWKIVIERKNIIYTLEPQDGSYMLAQTD